MRWFRKIAGIDEGVLAECPRSDRIWTTQIGVALSMTFAIVTFIVYYSLQCIDATHIVYDVKAQEVVLERQHHAIWKEVLFGVIALTVATTLWLFDRALYQSDWFVEEPYGIDRGTKKRIVHSVKKTFRIGIRLGISLALAFALSVFIELKLYEGMIVGAMQQEHIRQNKPLYDEIRRYKQSLAKRIATLRKSEAGLLRSLAQSNQPNRAVLSDTYVKQLDAQIQALGDAASLTEQRDALESKIIRAQTKLDAEVAGIKRMRVDNDVVEASGIKGYGTRAKIEHRRIERLKRRLSAIDRRIRHIRDLQETKQSYIRQHMRQTETMRAEAVARIKSELHNVRHELHDLISKRHALEQSKIRSIMNDPRFISFRDGPMHRMAILEKLKNDPVSGEEIRRFSWIVKLFLIFLEVVPVMSKMLFGPPSVYAVRMQARVRQAVAEVESNRMEQAIGVEQQRRRWRSERFRNTVAEQIQEQVLGDQIA